MGCANAKVPHDGSAYDQVIVQEKVQNLMIPSPYDDPPQPDVDLTEIQEMIQQLQELKESLTLLTYERNGIQRSLDITQAKLVEITTDQNNSKSKYQNLLTKVVEKDVEDVYRGLTSSNVDKRILIEILTTRPKWHITLIAEAYERQYNVPLFLQIREKLTSQFGKLTGSKTGLSRLLEYMTSEQPERDGSFLKASIGDLELLLEVILTRTNHQIHAALNDFEIKNGKHFLDAIRGTISPPLFAFLSEVCLCRRDETGVPLTINVAESTALELAQAIESKNHDLCTQILVNLSDLQIASIVREYNRLKGPGGVGNRNLEREISTAFSGDYRTALRAKCREKYFFLASHIYNDKETLCRILGSLSRRDCKLLRSSYDANKSSFGGKSFTEMLREEIKKESYLAACLNLVSTDTSKFPLGVDREPSEDNVEIESVGDNAYRAAKESYSSKDMQTMGSRDTTRDGVDLVIPTLPNRPTPTQLTNFAANVEGLMMDTENQIKELRVEIEQLREFLFTVTRQCAQAEKWSRIYKAYASSLRQHLEKYGEPGLPSPGPSPNSKKK